MKSVIAREDADYVVKLIRPVLDKLRGKTLLITGVTGFMGSCLLESVASYNDLFGGFSPCRVTGLARNPHRLTLTASYLLNRNDVTILTGDAADFEFSESFDYVIHAAAPVDPVVLSNDRIGTADSIVNCTRQVLRQSSRRNIGRLLHISSGAVYGRQPLDMTGLREDYLGGPDITDPNWAYGEAKRYSEILCSMFRKVYGLSIVTARPFTFMGPYQSIDAGFAVTQFIKSGLSGKPIRIEGDGTPLRSYCYAADLCIALWKILLESKDGSVYNVGSEEAISILELAYKVKAAIGGKTEVVVMRDPVPDQKPARYIPDVSRLKKELDVSPNFSLNEALSRTISWMHEINPAQRD